jgi:hypothetical protein
MAKEGAVSGKKDIKVKQRGEESMGIREDE